MGADESAITATYTDGILVVRVPMGAEAPATRTVAISRS
jgi:HSP20 family molecular chaperone IbpA